MLDTIITILGVALIFYLIYSQLMKLNDRLDALENKYPNRQDIKLPDDSNPISSLFHNLLNCNSGSNKLFDLSLTTDPLKDDSSNHNEYDNADNDNDNDNDNEDEDEDDNEDNDDNENDDDNDNDDDDDNDNDNDDDNDNKNDYKDIAKDGNKDNKDDDDNFTLKYYSAINLGTSNDIDVNNETHLDDKLDMSDELYNTSENILDSKKECKRRGRKKKISL